MKKIISIVLAVMLVVSATAVSFGAVSYNPDDSYTVSKDTPTCEEAIKECGGGDTQTVYFQLPAEDPAHPENNWKNRFNSTDLGLDYCQVCVYWFGNGVGVKWPNGAEQKWVGYKATLIDEENRIYRAVVPADGGSAAIIWNNGVNGGMDPNAEIFNYARQLMDANIEGAEDDSDVGYSNLPEGTPDPDNCDGCITIIDYSRKVTNSLTGFDNFGAEWYVYYGDGCYGKYSTESKNFTNKHDCCLNPEHLADPQKYHPNPGDVNQDGETNVSDAELIQMHLVGLLDGETPETQPLTSTQLKIADVDEDTYVSIIDATRIQRTVAGICDIYGNKL